MSDLDLVINLLANSRGMEAGYKRAVTQQVSLNREMRKGQAAANVASRSFNTVERDASRLTNTMRGLGVAAGATFGLFAIQSAAVGIKNTLADYQDFRTQLKFLSGDTATYTQNMTFLDDLSKRHGKSMLDLGQAYTNLAALQRGNIITLDESQRLTEGLSNASSALGASNEQLSLVYYGLGQALSQPKVQAQELNQVTEPLPGLLQELTKAAGLTNKSFRDLVIEGKVTSAMFRDTLLTALEAYDGAAVANIDNIRAQERALSNMRLKAIEAFEAPIDNIYSELLSVTSDGLGLLADNADVVIDVLGTLTGIALVRGTAALTNYSIASAASLAATIKKTNAERAGAIVTLNAAKEENRKALALQLTAKRQLEASVLIGNQARATSQLDLANKRAAASQAALTVATRAYTASATVATSVARGLSAVVGGIPGILLLGGYALYEYASANDAASKSANKFADATQASTLALNPFANYTRSQAVSALGRLTGRLEQAKILADEMRTRFENPFFNTTIGEVKEAEREVDQLAEKINILQGIVGQPSLPSAPNLTEYDQFLALLEQGEAEYKKLADTQLKEADKLISNMQRQIALHGQTTNVAKLRYELEKGNLSTINEEVERRLIAEAEQLDLLAKQKKASDVYDKTASSLKEQIDLFGEISTEARVRYEIENSALGDVNEKLKQKLLLDAKQLDKLREAKKFQDDFEKVSTSLQTPIQKEQATNQENLSILRRGLEETPASEINKRFEINQLIEAEQRRHSEAMNEINGTTKNVFDALWSESFDRFASGIGQATADALFESKSLGDGIQNVVKGAGKQMVATLVEIGVKRLALAAINATASTTEAAASTTAQVASGAAITTAMAPAAAATTLATGGLNGVGSVATIAIVGAALASMFAGLFDKGGTIPSGKFGIAGELGPEIVKGPAVVTSRVESARIFNRNRQSTREGGSEQINITVNDNKVMNFTGSDGSDAERVRDILDQNNQALKNEIAEEINRGRGQVYSAVKGVA